MMDNRIKRKKKTTKRIPVEVTRKHLNTLLKKKKKKPLGLVGLLVIHSFRHNGIENKNIPGRKEKRKKEIESVSRRGGMWC